MFKVENIATTPPLHILDLLHGRVKYRLGEQRVRVGTRVCCTGHFPESGYSLIIGTSYVTENTCRVNMQRIAARNTNNGEILQCTR